MLNILLLLGPLFGLVALGHVAVRSGFYPRTHLPALGAFVVNFALPALLWRALGQRNPAEVINGPNGNYLAAYLLGSLALLGSGWWWGRSRGQSRSQAAMTGMGMSCANTAFIGYPLTLQLVGPEATVALALTILVENFVVLPLCLVLADTAAPDPAPGSAGAQGQAFWRAFARALWGLRKNSIVLGILAGLLTGALGPGLPPPLGRVVELLAGASAPLSLFFIGGTLVGMQVGQMLPQVSAVAVGKLLLHPLAVGLALWALGPVSPPLVWAGVVMAAAPMLSIYPILGQRHGLQAVNAACMLGATLSSALTLPALLLLLQVLWGAPR